MTDPLDAIPAAKREEARRWDALFQQVTGWSPALWQGRILGYGRYAYRYDSGRAGAFLATGFAMRARDVSLHILPGYSDHPGIAARLGPHRRGNSCWYVRSFDTVDSDAAADLIRAGLAELSELWPVEPT